MVADRLKPADRCVLTGSRVPDTDGSRSTFRLAFQRAFLPAVLHFVVTCRLRARLRVFHELLVSRQFPAIKQKLFVETKAENNFVITEN